MFISDLNYLESVDQGDNIQGGCRFCNNKRNRGNGRQKRLKASAYGYGYAKGVGDTNESSIEADFIANTDRRFSNAIVFGSASAES
jgi:hypothetical protein